MGEKNDARNGREEVTVIFREPRVRPGTPEAAEFGCLCRFEANMEAAFLAAERGDTETRSWSFTRTARCTRSSRNRWTMCSAAR